MRSFFGAQSSGKSLIKIHARASKTKLRNEDKKKEPSPKGEGSL
jgi:hypothetical protein